MFFCGGGLVSVGAIGASATMGFKAMGIINHAFFLAFPLINYLLLAFKKKLIVVIDYLNPSTHGFKLLTRPLFSLCT